MVRNSDNLYTILYVSRSIMWLDRFQLNVLLESSRKNNLKKNITGMLLYLDQHFMQLLEGNKQDLLDLLNVIGNDTRHYNLRVLFQKSIKHRCFSDWSMAYKSLSSDEIKNLTGRSSFLKPDENVLLDNIKSAQIYKTMRQFRQNPGWFFGQPL